MSSKLFRAVYSQNIPRIYYALECGDDINMVAEDGRTCIYDAIFNRNLEIVKILIENGADVNIKDNENFNIIGLYYNFWKYTFT